MNAGRVQMLLIVGESNPVQTAPADLNFADAMSKVQTRLHSGLFFDETATLCHWHVPAAHLSRSVERRAHRRRDGVDRAAADPADVRRQVGARNRADAARSSGAQRLRPRARILDAAAAGQGGERRRCRAEYAVRAPAAQATPSVAPPRAGTARRPGRSPGGDAAGASRTSPRCVGPDALAPPPMTPEQRAAAGSRRPGAAGCTTAYIAGTAFAAPGARRTCRTRRTCDRPHLAHPCTRALCTRRAGFEVNFRRDPDDLRRALRQQRLAAGAAEAGHQARPGTTRALIAPATAERLGVENGDIIEVTHEGRRLRIPVWINPGHAAGGDHDSRRLRPHARGPRRQRHRLQRLRAARQQLALVRRGRGLGDRRRAIGLVNTQDHWSIEGRNIVRSAPLEEFKKNPAFAKDMEHMKLDKPISLYPPHEYHRHAVGHGHRPEHLHRLHGSAWSPASGREQHPGRRQGAGGPQPRDALAAHRPLLHRPARQPRHVHCSRCRVSSARTRPAKWSARSRRPCTATKA